MNGSDSLKIKESREVSEAIQHHIIAKFGKPNAIQSNKGLEFVSEVSTLCQKVGIRQLKISTRHPQANRQAEHYVCAIKLALSIVLCNKLIAKPKWLHYLPACLMALWLCRQEVLPTSPFFIIYGMDPSILILSNTP